MRLIDRTKCYFKGMNCYINIVLIKGLAWKWKKEKRDLCDSYSFLQGIIRAAVTCY